jgi:hypothetical protein
MKRTRRQRRTQENMACIVYMKSEEAPLPIHEVKRKKKKLLKLALVIKNDSHGSKKMIYLADKMPQHRVIRTLWSL